MATYCICFSELGILNYIPAVKFILKKNQNKLYSYTFNDIKSVIYASL